MKVIVPDYYKDFKCIAGACEDTCCAGWEVDVDEDSYQRYRQTGGSIGERLKAVMIPKSEGDGCSFRLMPDKRCPFLNEKNLCDIYSELGEDALCDTCAYFPRFVHDYGSCREMGPAPSCFTAAQLMVAKQGETKLVSFEDKSISVQPNDICPEAFFMLQDLRKEIFGELWDEESGLHLHKRLIRILDKVNVVESELVELLEEFADDTEEICDSYNKYEDNRAEGNAEHITRGELVKKSPKDNKETVFEKGSGVNYTESAGSNDKKSHRTEEDIISKWLIPFDGMEIINNDWMKLLEVHRDFCDLCPDDVQKEKVYREFDEGVIFVKGAFKQLLFYYYFRYILEAVHDGRLMCAVKTGVVAYLAVKRFCVAVYHKKGALDKDEMADIFHLYSRHIEHSDVNFEHYRDAYDRNAEYGITVLKKLLR